MSKRIAVIVAIMLAGTIVLSGCSKNQAASADSKSTKPTENRYTDKVNEFSVVIPNGWDVKPHLMGTAVILMEPLKPGAVFRHNINVVMIPHDGTVPPADWFSKTTAGVEKMLDGFKELSRDDKEYTLEFTHTTLGTAMPVHCRVKYIVGKNYIFVVTGTSTPETANKYKPVFDAFFKGFKTL